MESSTRPAQASIMQTGSPQTLPPRLLWLVTSCIGDWKYLPNITVAYRLFKTIVERELYRHVDCLGPWQLRVRNLSNLLSALQLDGIIPLIRGIRVHFSKKIVCEQEEGLSTGEDKVNCTVFVRRFGDIASLPNLERLYFHCQVCVDSPHLHHE